MISSGFLGIQDCDKIGPHVHIDEPFKTAGKKGILEVITQPCFIFTVLKLYTIGADMCLNALVVTCKEKETTLGTENCDVPHPEQIPDIINGRLVMCQCLSRRKIQSFEVPDRERMWM